MSPALGCFAWIVWRAEMISRPWLFVRVRSPSGNVVTVARELQRLFAVEVGGPGREVRAGEVVVHRGGDVDVDAADLVDHLLEVREVGADHPADRHAHDRRHRVGLGAQVVAARVVDDVRVELGRRPGPGCRGGCRCIVADRSAGFTPITWMASARPGSSGDCAGSSDRAPVPSTSAKNGCCGPPVARAAPSFVTWNHTAPAAGTGFAEQHPRGGDAAGERAARTRTGATSSRVSGPAAHFGGSGPVAGVVAVVVVVGDEAGAVAGHDHAVGGDPPAAEAGRAATRSRPAGRCAAGRP